MQRPILTLGLLLVLALPAGASADDWAATWNPTLEVNRRTGDIVLDGSLDDPGWRDAALATHFAEHSPGDQTRPPFDTDVWVTYDDENLYVGFLCHDDPRQVRASFTRRDACFGDDLVFVCIDPFADGASAYEIAVNPLGIQGDLYFSQNGGEDSKFDMVYHTAARITEQGWIAEFAIPFSSLRFPDRHEQVWKMDFWRNHERGLRTQASWAAYDRDESCWPCQWGTVTGINGVKPAGGVELIPAFTADQAGRRHDEDGDGEEEFVNGKIMGEPSLTARWAVTSDVVADATLNPDFSQVESDAAQIDVNSNFALFYPERRPFFQERADLFSTWFNAVYTRSINDPSVAGKLTGRTGKTAFALLSAYDLHSPVILPFAESSAIFNNGESMNNVARVKHEIGEQTHLGFVGTDRRYRGGGSGSLVGFDGSLRLSSRYRIEAQYLHTFTTEPVDTLLTEDLGDMRFDDGRYTAAFDGESFEGDALYACFKRDGRNLSFYFDYWDRSPTFRADNGFEVRNDRREGVTEWQYIFRFDDGLFEYIAPGVNLWRAFGYDDVMRDEGVRGWLSLRLRKAQTNIHAQYLSDAETYQGREYGGLYQRHICFSSRPSGRISLGGSANYGHRVCYGAQAVGGQSDYTAWVDLKPWDRLLLETSCLWSRSRNLVDDATYFDGHILRSKLSLQLTRELSCRLVVQYHDFAKTWEADPLLQYQLNPFSIFYVGSTRDYRLLDPNGPGADGGEDWRLTARQYFLKVQYLFRV